MMCANHSTGCRPCHRFTELRRQLSLGVGDPVVVTDRGGHETQGNIAELSASALALIVDGARQDFVESDVSHAVASEARIELRFDSHR